MESPNVPADYLRGGGVNDHPERQRRKTHLKLWRELPQLDQRLDLVSQHKLETLEVVIARPIPMVHWSWAKIVDHLRDSLRKPQATYVGGLRRSSSPSFCGQT